MSGIQGPGHAARNGELAPPDAAAFAGVTGEVELRAPWVGRYSVHYVDASHYRIAGHGWIPDSAGTHTYARTGSDRAEMEFDDDHSGRVTCNIHYTSTLDGTSECTYPNGVTLPSRFHVPVNDP
ncbi:MAG: hypothetical protein HY904_15685 [Deltaproteobacteria bacterium]|nr:hypothetical protein [Deltaproteobacteria bacterium]